MVAEPMDVKTVSKITESAEKLSFNEGLSLIASSFLHEATRRIIANEENKIILVYLAINFILPLWYFIGVQIYINRSNFLLLILIDTQKVYFYCIFTALINK